MHEGQWESKRTRPSLPDEHRRDTAAAALSTHGLIWMTPKGRTKAGLPCGMSARVSGWCRLHEGQR